jgi:hypothetical protein
MIHIVEINEQNRAHVWFAFDEADLIRKVLIKHEIEHDMTVHKQTTARQLSDERLATQFGWDTPVYRADYLLGHNVYQTEPISELRACVAAIASAHEFRIYPDDETAADEIDRDPLYRTKEGFEACIKFRAQLVEFELIAEDF